MDFMDSKRYKELRNEFTKVKDDLKPLFNEPKGIHGLGHAKRVYILANLIADYEGIDEYLREVLSYCALYHDIGRTIDNMNSWHGEKSFEKITQNNLIDNNYKYLETVRLIIENHCYNDELGILNINASNIQDKEQTLYLYKAFKDADGLDRVRICDLDINYLRLESSKKLVNISWELFYGKLLEVLVG